MAAAKGGSKRLYQVWKGNNKFFFGGRLIFGPDMASLFLSTILVAGPAITFCTKTYVKIADKHTRHREYWHPVLITGSILTVLDLFFLFLTSCRDPGIVHRNTRPPESDEEALEINTPSMEWVNERTPHLKLPRTKDVMVNGHSVRVKFCDTCLLYCPPRVSHCSICNNCVQRFDHHCPWVGQCIGMTTYENFQYRYDRRNNPYNRGIIQNNLEIFCSHIPPSMNQFRSFVEEEDEPVAVESAMPNLGDSAAGSKDVVMRAKVKGDSSYSLSEILQKLEGDDDSDDNSKAKEEEETPTCDQFFSAEHAMKEHFRVIIMEDGLGQSMRSPNAGDEGRESAQSWRGSGASFSGDGVKESARSSRGSVDSFSGDGSSESAQTSRASVRKSAQSLRGSVDSFTGDRSRESARTSRGSFEGFSVVDEMRHQLTRALW